MWYVVHTKPKEEFRALENLERQHFQCYLPLIQVEKLLRGKFTIKTEPLFGRYLFVNLNSSNQNFSVIQSTRGVNSIVSFARAPSTISDEVVDAFRSIDKPFQMQLYSKGDSVQIFSGPLKGLSGIFEQKSGDDRALVLVEFMRKTHPLQINLADMAPALN